jgi:hypothetical protein
MTGIRRALPPLLLAAATLAAALAAGRSLACPIQMPPQPLRTLYTVSERVVVARVGARQVERAYDGTETASVRIALHVTENVKGPHAGLVYFQHDEYIGEDAAESEADAGESVTVSAFSGRTIPELKRGERYLFFLEPLEEGGVYGVNDESYGIKQLSDDDLKVYLERMKELAEMARQKTEDKHALVEWLVRCAEQPATRWEGAFELLQSAWSAASAAPAEEQGAAVAEAPDAEEASDAQAAGEAQAAPQPQATEAPAAAGAAENVVEVAVPSSLVEASEIRHAGPDPELAPLLNAVQKQRLADAFFATDVPKQGDDELMLLVKDFGDARFPDFILARLHRFEEDPPMGAEFWLRTLADSLKNEQLIKLADSYTQEATYHEEDETEAQPEAAAPAEAGGEEETAEEVKRTPADREAEAAREAAASERARVKRSAMLKAVLAHIDLFVSTGQLAAN